MQTDRTMDRRTEGWTEGWKESEGQKDKQTLFYRTLPATAGVQKAHHIHIFCFCGCIFVLRPRYTLVDFLWQAQNILTICLYLNILNFAVLLINDSSVYIKIDTWKYKSLKSILSFIYFWQKMNVRHPIGCLKFIFYFHLTKWNLLFYLISTIQFTFDETNRNLTVWGKFASLSRPVCFGLLNAICKAVSIKQAMVWIA